MNNGCMEESPCQSVDPLTGPANTRSEIVEVHKTSVVPFAQTQLSVASEGRQRRKLNKKKILTQEKRLFDRTKFKLASCFREDIDRKLQLRERMTTREETFVCRELVRKIEKQTLGPPRDDLRWIADLILEKYPHLIFSHNLDATAVIIKFSKTRKINKTLLNYFFKIKLSWTDKLASCLSRKRSELGYALAETWRPR